MLRGGKSSQLAEPALPSRTITRASGSALPRVKSWVSQCTQTCAQTLCAHLAGERARARALRPRPPVGRGKTRPRSWRGPGSARASSHARRCCGSAGHVTAGPPPRRAVPPHRDSALCAGCSPSGSGPERRLSRTRRKVVVVAAVSETQVRTARRSSGVTRLRFLVGGFAEILGGERRRCALGTGALLGLRQCLMASSGF